MRIRVPGPHSPLWVLAESIGSAVFSLASLLLVGRVIGPEAAGLGTIAIAAFILLEILVSALFTDALVQLPGLAGRHSESAATLSVLLGVIAGLALAGLGPFLAAGASAPEETWLALALAPLMPLAAFSGTVSGLLLREERFRLLALRLLLGQPLALAAGLLAARAGYGPWAMVLLQVVTVVVTFLLMLGGVGRRLRPRLDMAALRELWPVAGPTLAGVVVMLGKYRLFILELSLVVAPSVLALCHFGFRMLDAALAIVWQTVSRLAIPRLCALQANRAELAEAYGDFAQLQALVGFPICAGVALTAPDLVRVFMGPVWNGSAVVMQITAVAAMVGFVQGDHTSLFIAVNKARRNFYIAVATLVVPLVALAVLRPRTPEEVAFAWAAQSVVLPPFLLWIVLGEVRRSPAWLARRLAPGIGATAVMAVAVLGVQNACAWQPLGRLVASVGTGAVAFAFVALLALGGRMPRALVRSERVREVATAAE